MQLSQILNAIIHVLEMEAKYVVVIVVIVFTLFEIVFTPSITIILKNGGNRRLQVK